MAAGKDVLSWSVSPPSWICAALVVTTNGKRYDLDKQGIREYRLGRLQDICIEHQTASRFHAVIAHHKDGGLHIVDQKSANGTFIDGKEIPPGAPVKLSHGSVIRFGECPDEFKVEFFDRREGAKRDMMSQLAGYDDDDDLDEGGGSRFVSAGYKSTEAQRQSNRGWARDSRDSGPNDRPGGARQFSETRRAADDGGRGREQRPPDGKGRPERGSNFGAPPGPDARGAGGLSQGKGGPQSATGAGVSDLAQKRKMLWGSKARDESSKNTATWTSLSTSLHDSEAQDKFLKLMGGKKAGNEADAAAAAAAAADVDYGGMQHALQREFETALHRSHGNAKHGLG